MFNILVTFRDIEYFWKINYEDICQLIRDTYLFTSRDMGYMVPPYTNLVSVCLHQIGLQLSSRYQAEGCIQINKAVYLVIHKRGLRKAIQAQ